MTDRPNRDPDWWVPALSAVIAAVLGGLWCLDSVGFALDDAWIHQAYAKSLRGGEGLSYNPGDWETGASSPLWVMVLAAWPTEGNEVLATKGLGVIMLALNAALASRIVLLLAARRATDQSPLPLATLGLMAGVLIAICPTLVQGAVSGMEVSLASACLLGATVLSLRGQALTGAVVGVACIWARPETLFFLAVFCPVTARAQRSAAALAPLAGALLGLAAWCGLCLVVSGHLWPNTQYVKAAGGGLDGLGYVRDHVLLWQPWLISLTGLALLALLVRDEVRNKDFEAQTLLAAWAFALVATALSRPLHPGVLFFESRYFAIFAAVPMVVLPLAVVSVPRRFVGLALLIPVVGLGGLQSWQLRRETAALESSVRLLHEIPARELAELLPDDAVVAVEGAGAHRYFLPRSIRVVDMLGLNDRSIAHAPTDLDKACVVVDRQPTHLVVPDPLVGAMARIFEFKAVGRYHDPAYAQVDEPYPLSVHVLEVVRPQPGLLSRCNAKR